MKKLLLLLLAFSTLLYYSCGKKRAGAPRVLVFTKTTGFRHASITPGIAAIQNMGKENGFDVDTTENAEMFNEDSLKKYSAIISSIQRVMC